MLICKAYCDEGRSMRRRKQMLSRNHLAVNFLLLVAWLSLSFFGIHGQLDSLGFISIDCGYTENPNYIDSEIGITYVSDEGFTDSGLTHTVNLSNMDPDLVLPRRYQTLRFFPHGTRNCYTLQYLTPGGKYLVRASFWYDNYYDYTPSMPPIFDLYLGVNYWTTVDILSADNVTHISEIIVESPANYLQVCLINTQSGTPFISGLDLRQFQGNFYPQSSATQSLVLYQDGPGLSRYHLGTAGHIIRYPDDRYDRIWQSYNPDDSWKPIVHGIINGTVKNYPNDNYGAPSAVMRSVSIPKHNDSDTMVGLSAVQRTNYIPVLYVLYFTEVETLQENELREFNVLLDDNLPLVSAFRPEQMLTTVVTGTAQSFGDHFAIVVATRKSNKPPLISAMELYLIRPVNGSATDSEDASAIMTIKTRYSVGKNWAGDPCLPVDYAWDGLNCTYNTTSRGVSSRIMALYLSSSKLNGEIDPSFGKLTRLQHLDLSHNNLSGSIPNFLGQLPSLVFLDLSSNNLIGPIPTSLLQKSKNGSLTLRTDDNPNLCTIPASCDRVSNEKKSIVPNKKKSIVKIVTTTVTVGIAVLVLYVAFAIWYRRKRTKAEGQQLGGIKQDRQPMLPDNYAADVGMPIELNLRSFRYKELGVITGSFENKIAEGGFGPVYAGKLDNGTAVAVKMRSQASSQGDKEFWAEVKHLSMLRHKNLVPLLGYCKDEEHLGLVYEYMAGGNVEQRLIRGGTIEAPLTWSQRLKIALDSARGLHYLHSALSTPLIHRDVKTKNILLTEKLEAKISDLGLARAISSEGKTHTVTSTLSGTPGYVDPEYLKAGELRGKTDVYSFGIVLLVLITALPTTVVVGDKLVNIADWVREMLSLDGSGRHGDISSVIDHNIRAHCDLVSVWKVAELALRCAQREDAHARPTMAEVMVELEKLQQQQEDGDGKPVAGVHDVVQFAEEW